MDLIKQKIRFLNCLTLFVQRPEIFIPEAMIIYSVKKDYMKEERVYS